ncbi:MAG: hypothetical protein GPJ54_05710 [Candidatus Heimdallarchaeota archaeon]|nr:hypothetical protein [Candidatus Heimdallarchaeota archaeon]
MTYKILKYDPKLIENQVDLIWESTDSWKYPYQTSYDSIKQAYSAESFDPTTRFYALEGDQLIGYVTSAVVKDTEKGDYGTLRFPLVKNNDENIVSDLLGEVEQRFLELGISRIRAPAGEGMGNTVQIAEKFGFKQTKTILKRSKVNLNDLKISGNFDHVSDYNDTNAEKVKEIFMKKMGMPEKQGEGFFQWALTNKERKESSDGNMTSWKVTKDNDDLTGYSYLHRSDHNPELGQFAPIWSSPDADPVAIHDGILSAHVDALGPHGMKTMQTFLITPVFHLEKFYGKFGFNFENTYSYEKDLSA